MEVKATASTYEGKPIITLTNGPDTRPFMFGLKKAQMILQRVDAIKKFVDANVGKAEKAAEKKAEKKAEAVAVEVL